MKFIILNRRHRPKLMNQQKETCWKLLTVLPILLPISGSFLGPKSNAATPAITASSGTPRPNRALQVSAAFLLLCSGRIATKERVFGLRWVVAMKQLENKEERDDERGRVTGGGEDRVATDVAITALFQSFFFSSSGCSKRYLCFFFCLSN